MVQVSGCFTLVQYHAVCSSLLPRNEAYSGTDGSPSISNKFGITSVVCNKLGSKEEEGRRAEASRKLMTGLACWRTPIQGSTSSTGNAANQKSPIPVYVQPYRYQHWLVQPLGFLGFGPRLAAATFAPPRNSIQNPPVFVFFLQSFSGLWTRQHGMT